MRLTAIAAMFVIAALPLPAGSQPADLDLDRPGAMDAFARANPDHHRRVVELVRAAEYARCDSGELRRLQVELVVADLECSLAIMTSDPPRQRIAFMLDRTRYATVVTLRNAGAKLVPVR